MPELKLFAPPFDVVVLAQAVSQMKSFAFVNQLLAYQQLYSQPVNHRL